MLKHTIFIPSRKNLKWHGQITIPTPEQLVYTNYQSYLKDALSKYLTEAQHRISDVSSIITDVSSIMTNDVSSITIDDVAQHNNNNTFPNIIYINLKSAVERNRLMIQELQRQHFGIDTKIFRFEAISNVDRAKACYLSHMHVIAWAATHCQGHVLVLEDDFAFCETSQVYIQAIEATKELTHDQWDVIHLGQYVHEWQALTGHQIALEVATATPEVAIATPEVPNATPRIFRALHSTTGSGYLIHKDYIHDLAMKFHQALEERIHKPKFDPSDCQDQLQIYMQQQDLWIAYDKPLGSQTEGYSTIGLSTQPVFNSWRCNSECNEWYDSVNVAHPLRLRPLQPQLNIAICLDMKNTENLNNSESCIHHLQRKFYKPSKLTFYTQYLNQILPQTTWTKYDLVFYVSSNLWLINTLPAFMASQSQPQLIVKKNSKHFYDCDFFGGDPESFLKAIRIVLQQGTQAWQIYLATQQVPTMVIDNTLENYFGRFVSGIISSPPLPAPIG
jgi:GR25 family glycosyltransferase involved in LPS biosynthesis